MVWLIKIQVDRKDEEKKRNILHCVQTQLRQHLRL